MDAFKQLRVATSALADTGHFEARSDATSDYFKSRYGSGAGSSVLYDAAMPSRARQNIGGVPQDSRRDLNRMSRTALTGKARYLYANDGFTRGAIRDKARYSVGHGLRPVPQKGTKAQKKARQEYWKQWCKVADVRGQYDFNKMQQILSISVDRDGDIGLVMVKSPSGFPQVQMVESHRIGDPGLDGPVATGEGTYWFDGLKLDESNRVVAYSVVTQDPFGVKTKEEIPAANFIHLFDGERADQFRGITALYHAINTLQDKKEIIDFEKKGVKMHSALAAVLKTKSNALAEDWKDSEGASENGGNANGASQSLNLTEVLEGGEIKVIGQNDNLELTSSNRPSPAFTGFLEFLLRDVATGLGLPYEFVWDAAKLGGTGSRLILEKAQRTFNERQDLLVQKVLNRLYFWVMSVAVKRGDLEYVEGDWDVKWQRPSEITVDAGRYAAADLADVNAGLMTKAEHYGRRGMDWSTESQQKDDEVDDLLTRAGKLADAHEVEISYVVQLLQQQSPNLPPDKTPPSPAKPAPKPAAAAQP